MLSNSESLIFQSIVATWPSSSTPSLVRSAQSNHNNVATIITKELMFGIQTVNRAHKSKVRKVNYTCLP